MKSKYVKPCVCGSGKEVENAIPAALAGFAAKLVAGVLAGAVATRAMGNKITTDYPNKQNLVE